MLKMWSPYIFVTSAQVVLKLEATLESSGGVAKMQIARLRARVSDSVGLEPGPRACTANKFPGDTDFGGHSLQTGPLLSGKEKSLQWLSSYVNEAQRSKMVSDREGPMFGHIGNP